MVTKIDSPITPLEQTKKTNEIIDDLDDKLYKSEFNGLRSNCITYIPQDIKLELDNGTLTLKAGSKVYIPNDAGVFNEVTTSNDLTCTRSTTGQELVYINAYGSLACWDTSLAYSGTTAPSGQQYMLWYDTTNNSIKETGDSGSTWTSGGSLPIGIVTTSGSIVSIDQVFNGFGYIGSTVFALPGVELLFGYGRNEDGTLYNEKREITSVLTLTPTYDFTLYNNFFVWHDGGVLALGNGRYDFWKIGTPGDVPEQDFGHLYNPATNRFYFGNQNTHQWDMTADRVVIVSFGQLDASGKISNFSLKNTYRAIDWNDKGIVSSWPMPSGRYTNLTLGASGSTYIAPANGYFTIDIGCNSGQYVNMQDGSNIYGINQKNYDGGTIRLLFPILKGKLMYISYDASGPVYGFRFVYAKGEV